MYPRTFIANPSGSGVFTFATLPSSEQMRSELPGVQAYTSDVGMVYWNGSSWVAEGKIYVDPRDWNGYDPTGVNPMDVILNAAIQQAFAAKVRLIIPEGFFLLNNPLLFYSGGGSKIEIEGQGAGLGGGPGLPSGARVAGFQANTILCANFIDRPAVIFQNNRNCVLRNLAIIGGNTKPFYSPTPPTDNPSDYILGGCATGLQSPYCGIAIDPFPASAPADGGYAGMGSYYGPSPSGSGSSNILFENITISQFVVGIAHSTAGVSQGDLMTFRNVTVQFCDSDYACGDSQARSCIFTGNCSFNWSRQAFDTINYGAAVPPLPFESLSPASFRGCSFAGDSNSVGRDAYNFIFWNPQGGGSLDECSFLSTSLVDLPPHIAIDFNARVGARLVNCGVNSSAGQFSLSTDYLRTAITNVANSKGRLRAAWQTRRVFDGNAEYSYQPALAVPYVAVTCDAASIVKGTTAYNITGITKAAAAVVTVNSALTTNPFVINQPITFAGVVGMVEINGLTGFVTAVGGSSGAWTATVAINSTAFTTYASGGTATVPTLTFTETTLGEVQVNDIILWKMLPQGYSGNAWTVPGWKVTNVDTGTRICTAIPMYDVAQYDTVANTKSVTYGNDTLAIVTHQWAPTQAVTGSTHSNTTLDLISPAALINGDWVQGAGIPAKTRVISGGGTASVVLSKAATASASGVTLYDGRLLTPTTTVAF